MALTPEQQEYKRQLLEATARADRLRRECKHVVEPMRPYADGSYGFCQCAICGISLRWYCPASPDHVCHYGSTDGFLWLLDGTRLPWLPEYDQRDCAPESCVYCGDPYERK